MGHRTMITIMPIIITGVRRVTLKKLKIWSALNWWTIFTFLWHWTSIWKNHFIVDIFHSFAKSFKSSLENSIWPNLGFRHNSSKISDAKNDTCQNISGYDYMCSAFVTDHIMTKFSEWKCKNTLNKSELYGITPNTKYDQ